MSDNGVNSASWKHPNELLKLHRLKQKQKALQARTEREKHIKEPEQTENLLCGLNKRKNPFLKGDNQNENETNKRSRLNDSDDSIFQLLVNQNSSGHASTHVDDQSEDDERPDVKDFIPVDWSLKTKLRILSPTALPGNQLKAIQESSGVTSFVRRLDQKSSSPGIDTTLGALFYQNTLYWEHPNLPWLTLFPRQSKLNNNCPVLGDVERNALMSDWTNSFTSLFRLVRSRQCPYFYVCANTFTVLFRAAGIGGMSDIHALLTPTSRGMRETLRKESIEYTTPLKKSPNGIVLNRSGDDSQINCDDNSEETKVESDEDDDEGGEKWLESLGVSAEEIKRLQSRQLRKEAAKECELDFSDQSIVLIEGYECQALFNFFLNSKSTTTKIGKLAGIPPTLLSPIAFQGATLKRIQTRTSNLRMDGVDYSSTELKGAILPHVLPYLTNILISKNTSFSVAMSNQTSTVAFTKASEVLMENSKTEGSLASDFVFVCESLSDCGIAPAIIKSMCKADKESVKILDRICFNKDLEGFTWN